VDGSNRADFFADTGGGVDLTRHPGILVTFIEVDASLELPIHAVHNIPVEEIPWT
jgi:hypothetical protein